MFQRKLKCWSYFILIFSAYILLNVCIEFSSAPYFAQTLDCYENETEPNCVAIQTKTSRLYISELLYGIQMVVQGTIALMYVDNIKVVKYGRWLRKSCKYCLILYPCLFLVRMVLFFDIHKQIQQVNPNNENKGLGGFFAEYIDNQVGSTLITLLIFALFILYYISNFTMIKLMLKMDDFVKSKNEDLVVA